MASSRSNLVTVCASMNRWLEGWYSALSCALIRFPFITACSRNELAAPSVCRVGQFCLCPLALVACCFGTPYSVRRNSPQLSVKSGLDVPTVFWHFPAKLLKWKEFSGI